MPRIPVLAGIAAIVVAAGLVVANRSGIADVERRLSGPTPLPVVEKIIRMGSPAVRFVSVSGAAPGGQAGAEIESAPDQNCFLRYVTPSGRPSTAQGQRSWQVTDARGRASWSWDVTSNTGPGTGHVLAACGKDANGAPIGEEMQAEIPIH